MVLGDGAVPRELVLPPDSPALLADLKAWVRAAQHRAHRVINAEMLTLYWQIGDAIRTRQTADGWGTQVVDRIAADLRAKFPNMKNLNRSNQAALPPEADVVRALMSASSSPCQRRANLDPLLPIEL